jgi:hypothetical protein
LDKKDKNYKKVYFNNGDNEKNNTIVSMNAYSTFILEN